MEIGIDRFVDATAETEVELRLPLEDDLEPDRIRKDIPIYPGDVGWTSVGPDPGSRADSNPQTGPNRSGPDMVCGSSALRNPVGSPKAVRYDSVLSAGQSGPFEDVRSPDLGISRFRCEYTTSVDQSLPTWRFCCSVCFRVCRLRIRRRDWAPFVGTELRWCVSPAASPGTEWVGAPN